MHSVADISVLFFFFLSSCVFLFLTFFSSVFSPSLLFLFSATRHYIPADCNSHRQSCEFSSNIFICSEYSSSYIHLFLSLYYSVSPLSFVFLFFSSSLSPPFTPIILLFLLQLPFPFYSSILLKLRLQVTFLPALQRLN